MAQQPTALTMRLGTSALPNSARSWHGRLKAQIGGNALGCADLRQDFLHKLSTQVMGKNQGVVLEDLSVSGMLKNRKLSKGISRQGWYQFRALCEGKAALRIIGCWEATSQHCHKCVDFSTRPVVCDGCGAILDRDENGSHNIVVVEMGHRTWRECKTGSPAARIRRL